MMMINLNPIYILLAFATIGQCFDATALLSQPSIAFVPTPNKIHQDSTRFSQPFTRNLNSVLYFLRIDDEGICRSQFSYDTPKYWHGSIGTVRTSPIKTELFMQAISRGGSSKWIGFRFAFGFLYFMRKIFRIAVKFDPMNRESKSTVPTVSYHSKTTISRPILRPRVANRVNQTNSKLKSMLKVDLIEEEGPALEDRPTSAAVPQVAKLLSWALSQIIYKRALRVEGLDLQVEASSNLHALSGNLKTVWLDFRTLALPAIQITGGTSMCITGVDLKMLFILHRRLGAFKKPFQVRGKYIFTNNDFIASSAIRNIVQCILTASFSRLNLGNIKVTRVGLRGDRILIDGQSDIMSRFSCSAALDISRNGHVISLKSLKYGTQAGEFLFHAPWEVATVLPKDLVSCDMGDNTRIDSLSIKNGLLTVSGCFVVTPTPQLIVADIGKRGMVHFDVGEKISAIVSQVLDNALTFW